VEENNNKKTLPRVTYIFANVKVFSFPCSTYKNIEPSLLLEERERL